MDEFKWRGGPGNGQRKMNFVTFGTTTSIANINCFIWVIWNITCMKNFLKYYSRKMAKSLMPQHSSGLSFCEKHLMFRTGSRWADRWGRKFVESTFKLALEKSHFGILVLEKKWGRIKFKNGIIVSTEFWHIDEIWSEWWNMKHIV